MNELIYLYWKLDDNLNPSDQIQMTRSTYHNCMFQIFWVFTLVGNILLGRKKIFKNSRGHVSDPDGGLNHTETGPLICSFYMIGTIAMKGLSTLPKSLYYTSRTFQSPLVQIFINSIQTGIQVSTALHSTFSTEQFLISSQGCNEAEK